MNIHETIDLLARAHHEADQLQRDLEVARQLDDLLASNPDPELVTLVEDASLLIAENEASSLVEALQAALLRSRKHAGFLGTSSPCGK